MGVNYETGRLMKPFPDELIPPAANCPVKPLGQKGFVQILWLQ